MSSAHPPVTTNQDYGKFESLPRAFQVELPAGQALQQVEGDALRAQDGLDGPFDFGEEISRLHAVAVGEEGAEDERGVGGGEYGGGDGQAGDAARLLGDDHRLALKFRRDKGAGGHVRGGAVLFQGGDGDPAQVGFV